MVMPFGSTQSVNGVFQAPAQIGGSGRSYYNVPDAIAGEAATEVPFVSQATTTNGSIKGVGLSATDDFYKGQFVVLVDAAPGNGIAAIWARIVKYVGATQVMTLDSPIDFGTGFNCMIVNPAVVDMNKDQVGDVSIGKSCLLNLGGCKIKGKLDVTAGAFVWIRNGEVTDGLQDQRAIVGALRMDKLTVSARENIVYAFLKPNFVNVGSVEAVDCDFRGVVAGRQGIARWVIENCRNLGVNDGDGNIPYRLVEAYNLAIAFSNVSASITGDFDGVIFMAHGVGALTSAAPNYVSVFADIRPIAGGDVQGAVQSPRQFAFLHVSSTATATITATAGQVSITGGSLNNGAATDNSTIALDFALFRGRSYTGAGATLTLSMANPVSLDLSGFGGMSSMVTLDGTVASTGVMTLNGTAQRNVNLGDSSLAMVLILKALAGTGSVTIANAANGYNFNGGLYLAGIYFANDHTGGTPAITISSPVTIHGAQQYDPFGFNAAATSITVGTWTISSDVNIDGLSQFFPNGLTTVVTGGAWVNSGTHQINFASGAGGIVNIATHFGAGGTLTVNGLWRLNGGQHDRIRICHSRGAGNTVTRTGDTFIRNCVIVGPTETFVQAETATSTAVCTGIIYCDFVKFASLVIVDSTAVGSAVTGPGTVTFVLCDINGADFKSQVGLGTITWTGATLSGLNCNINGLFTLVGTPFDIVAFETCTFAKTVTSVSFSGSRPTSFYVYLKCTFAGLVAETTGRPDILDDYSLLTNDGNAKNTGDLTKGDSSAQAARTGATDVVDGVLWPTIGANNGTVLLVKSGVMIVQASSAINTGDYLVLDVVGTNYKVVAGSIVPGQGVGRALETIGAPGPVYAMVDLK